MSETTNGFKRLGKRAVDYVDSAKRKIVNRWKDLADGPAETPKPKPQFGDEAARQRAFGELTGRPAGTIKINK